MQAPLWRILAVCLLLAALPSCATVGEDGRAERDPWEKFNRRMTSFNDKALVVVRPIAKGYRKLVPKSLQRGLSNAFGNLGDISDMLNNLLQGKIKASLSDLARVTVNTTLGLGGLFDPASRMGLKDHEEDFGQTLALWGLPSGPYLVVPFLGPTTLRDAFGGPVDAATDPVNYLKPPRHRNVLTGMRLIHESADLLTAEQAIFGDRYIFIRDAYLQRRDFLVNDGKVEDTFGDDF